MQRFWLGKGFIVVAGLILVTLGMPANAAELRSLVEHGRYLVDSILACGNCHTPKSPTGHPILEKDLSGAGTSFTTPAFEATSSNITPDRKTGIGSWTDVEIKRALTEGTRPSRGRLANVQLAAVMPVSFFKALLPRVITVNCDTPSRWPASFWVSPSSNRFLLRRPPTDSGSKLVSFGFNALSITGSHGKKATPLCVYPDAKN